MTVRAPSGPIPAVAADAPPVAAPAQAAAKLPVLGEDEIIQLSIRPSPWCILLHSFKPLVALVLLCVAVTVASQGVPTLLASVALLLIVAAAFAAVVGATLHWASRLYVLTNRRVMQFHGIFSVYVTACGLTHIGRVLVRTSWYQPLLGIGTIHMVSTSAEQPDPVWEHVARPAEIHEILVRAIHKAGNAP